MVALPPLARDFVPMPLPMTLVFASTANDVSWPSAVTVSVVGATDLTVADARSLVLPAADTLPGNTRIVAARKGNATRIRRFIVAPLVRKRGAHTIRFLPSQRIVPRHFDHIGTRNLVVPGLPLWIPQNPQAPQTEHRKRENGGQTADERLGERQRLTIDAHDAQLADDPADRGLFPRPEADVIHEQEQEHGTVVIVPVQVQHLCSDHDQNDVED